MEYLSVFDRLTGKRLAFLKNAYAIGYTLPLNGLATATFTLPTSDPANGDCRPFNFVEVFDGDCRVDLFRILPATLTKDNTRREITYECEQVLSTLLDDVLFGWHQVGNLGTYTAQSIRYLLDRQQVPRWQLAGCDFRHQFLYGWENENLLSALLSIPKPFPEDYRWIWDTRSVPWSLRLEQRDRQVKGEIRYRKNLAGITKTVDPSNLATRLYCLGYGEGDNQLRLSGTPYLQADTADEYGVISKIWVDRRYQSEETLRAAGRALLEQCKRPYISYEVEAVDLYDLRTIQVGDTVRVVDEEEGLELLAPVVELSKPDLTGSPLSMTVTIANAPEDMAASMADLSDRQRIADLYSQGATNLDSHDFADNCGPNDPAILRFYVPEEAVRINMVKFTYTLLPFRGYSKGVEAAKQQSTTSGGGGGTYSSTGAGGGSRETSQAAGRATVTSGPSSVSSSQTGGYKPSNVSEYAYMTGPQDVTSRQPVYDDRTGPGGEDDHTHANYWHQHHYYLPGHTHRIDHTHQVEVPSHSHTVEIPEHAHSFRVKDHTHTVIIPEHSHETIYGIFSGGQAGAVTLSIDGREVRENIPPDTDVDITQYLSTDDSGRIQRSVWHTIELRPDRLTRIEASLITQLFINSRGGGDF